VIERRRSLSRYAYARHFQSAPPAQFWGQPLAAAPAALPSSAPALNVIPVTPVSPNAPAASASSLPSSSVVPSPAGGSNNRQGKRAITEESVPPPAVRRRLVVSVPEKEEPRPAPITITVHTLKGEVNRLVVPIAVTVRTFKEIYYAQYGIPPDQHLLLLSGKMLQDEKTLSSYQITKDTTLHGVLKLRGC